jgi:hypothetical protein
MKGKSNMPRKTIEVDKLVTAVNGVLAKHNGSREIRQGMINLLDYALHETGNYRGFRYLMQDEVPDGALPGVRYENGEILPYPERFHNTDFTRVQYS